MGRTISNNRQYIYFFGSFFVKNMCVRFELTSSARLGTCRSISWDPAGFFDGPWTVEVIGSSVVASLEVDPVGLVWRTVAWWRAPGAPAPCCCCIRLRLRSAFFTHPDTVEWWMPYFRAVSWIKSENQSLLAFKISGPFSWQCQKPLLWSLSTKLYASLWFWRFYRLPQGKAG